MGLVGIALIASALIFGGDRLKNLGDDKTGGGNEIPIASAGDFDPFGGDGEHPESTELAFDNNPTGTAWPTERYTSGIFDKDGVGIYVETGKSEEVTEVDLRLANPGSDIEIYAAPGASEAPDSIEDWTLVGQTADAGTDVKIPLGDHTASNFYLVWFTKLPIEEGGSDAVQEVSDIRLLVGE